MYRLLNKSKHNEYSIEAPRGSMGPLIPENNALISQIPQLPESIFLCSPKP